MKESNVALTETDRLVLASYCDMIDGLSQYLGSAYEFVLHSLEDMDRSVIKIINGFHTGRKVGAPITDLALSMLSRIEEDTRNDSVTYFCRNNNGEPLKSTTIVIRGEQKRIIGLLCINFYLSTPFADIIGGYADGADGLSGNPVFMQENFSPNVEEMVRSAARSARQQVEADGSIPPSLKNKEIVGSLCQQGIFKLKDAVVIVANELGISKNTVYLHIRAINGTSEK